MEIWEVVARESIRDVVTRYNANGDSGRFDEVARLFATDAVMELEGDDGPLLFRGRSEILTIFTGTRDRWANEFEARGSSDDSAYVRHRVVTLQIDFDDHSHARGYCYYQVIMAHGLDHWGRYFDRYELIGDRWHFSRRKVTVEGRTTDAPTS